MHIFGSNIKFSTQTFFIRSETIFAFKFQSAEIISREIYFSAQISRKKFELQRVSIKKVRLYCILVLIRHDMNFNKAHQFTKIVCTYILQICIKYSPLLYSATKTAHHKTYTNLIFFPFNIIFHLINSYCESNATRLFKSKRDIISM